jgi:HPt (histidine-containing phosphotransfer) domain-containing protein
MATMVEQEFRARLAALGERFAASVPVTLDKIGHTLAACDASFPPDPGQLAALHELLHGVAGSAGTFGFGELGQQCRRVDQMVRVVISAQFLGEADWAAVTQEAKRLLAWAEIDPRAPWPEAH